MHSMIAWSYIIFFIIILQVNCNDLPSINCSMTAQSLKSDVTKIRFKCPGLCSNEAMTSQTPVVQIGGFFPENSSICLAAEQLGISSQDVGIILLPTSPAFNQSVLSVKMRSFIFQDVACYVDKGQQFYGYSDFTSQGGECTEGTCGNALGSRNRPWCEVASGGWQYCDIAPACDDVHVISLRGSSYVNSSRFTGSLTNQNQHKIWIVAVRTGYKVEFAILDASFDISVGDNCNLTRDQVVLYHDFGDVSNIIQICDPGYRHAVTSSSNLLYVEFRANNKTKYFNAEIREISETIECGGEYVNVTSGKLHTPNYPNLYPNLVSCSWRIRTSKASLIRIYIQDFELQGSVLENCMVGDYVVIIDGEDPLVELCGSLQSQIITSSTNDVTLRFSTDSSGRFKGFSATFEVIERQNCEFDYFGEFGNFETPGFPESFTHHLTEYSEPGHAWITCKWNINFEPYWNISMTVLNISCSNSSSVSVYDVASGMELAELCNGNNVTERGNTTFQDDVFKITSFDEKILVQLTMPLNTSDDVTLRFQTAANYNPKLASTVPLETTSWAPLTLAPLTLAPLTSAPLTSEENMNVSSTTSKSQLTIPTSLSSVTSQKPSVSRGLTTFSPSATVQTTEPINRTVALTDSAGKSTSGTTRTVISVICGSLGVVLLVAIVVLVRRIVIAKARQRSQQRADETSGPRTEDFELASLRDESSA